MERIAFGVDCFTVFDTDVHAAAYTAVAAGASYPLVRGFGFGNFTKYWVVDEGVFVLFDVEAEKVFCFVYETHIILHY